MFKSIVYVTQGTTLTKYHIVDDNFIVAAYGKEAVLIEPAILQEYKKRNLPVVKNLFSAATYLVKTYGYDLQEVFYEWNKTIPNFEKYMVLI